MNAKQLIAVAVFALIGGTDFAGEATEFAVPPSTLSRATVVAELQQACARGELVAMHEADLRPEHTMSPTLSRAEVRAEARIAARAHTFSALYVSGV